ncbi:MAG TPA: hypothetical protein ENJ07_03600 [Gammaproteobacteria bacterium]|nr:hypothetical protein [Gammaproteobacteria bacterium]
MSECLVEWIKNIADKIIEKQADYVFALKDNHKQLHEAVIDYFETALCTDQTTVSQVTMNESINAEHGCIEIRRCYLSTCLDMLPGVSRIRKGYAPENFNTIRQLAINLLKKSPQR